MVNHDVKGYPQTIMNLNKLNVLHNTKEDVDAIEDNSFTVLDSVQNSPKLADIEAINTLPTNLRDFSYIEIKMEC